MYLKNNFSNPRKYIKINYFNYYIFHYNLVIYPFFKQKFTKFVVNLNMTLESNIKAAIRDVPDFPKPGIMFKDITPVFENQALCNEIVDESLSQQESYFSQEFKISSHFKCQTCRINNG